MFDVCACVCQWFSAHSWLIALTAAMISGVVVAITMTPFDVISTRLYNQPVDDFKRVNTHTHTPQTKGIFCNKFCNDVCFCVVLCQGRLYGGFVDCVMKVTASEGIVALYKGMTPVFVRLAPHTVLSMLLWDVMRQRALRYTN